MLILPASDRDSMLQRIEDLRETGGAAGCAVTGMRMMTMSIGEACYPQDGADAEQLLAVADRRMYLAKQRTRIPRPPMASLDASTFVTLQ